MRPGHSFSEYHPLVNLVYFALVLVFAMVFMHPLCLAVALLSATACLVSLMGKRELARRCRFMLPMLLLAALINPAFSHAGVTVLAWFPSGNPLTLESILYGLAAAVMLVASLTWFSCCSAVMTTDKFVYLFGRIVPVLSLLLSMTLRFVPRFIRQFGRVAEAQRGLGRDVAAGSLLSRLKTALLIFSIVVTWALENAVDTADSMKSRGYGLPGRTAFALYRFRRRDALTLLWMAFCGALVAWGGLSGNLAWWYYPGIGGTVNVCSAGICLVYLALCLTPVLLQWKEVRAWKRSDCKM